MMKSWREHPHLFANGKFSIKIPWMNNEIHQLSIHRLSEVKKYYRGRFDRECQLIARPIEDMADEEKNIYKSKLAYEIPEFVQTDRSMLYLLSIGCYPFDQDHFNNGDVIDIRRLKNE